MNLSDGKRNAWNYFNNGVIGKAYSTAESLNSEYPDDVETKYLLGCCLGRLGKYQEAVDVLNLCLDLLPDQPQTHVALGRVLKVLGRQDEAMKNFQTALNLDPSIADTYIALGDAYLAQRDITQARYHFNQAIRLKPDWALPHFNLGLLSRHNNENGEVTLKHFLNAVAIAPTAPEYLNSAGECLAALERYSEAIEKFAAAIDVNNNYFLARSNLIKVYVKLGEYTQAEKIINFILERKEYIPAVAMSFLLICKHLGRCDDALEYAKFCLNKLSLNDPETVNLNRQIALVLDYQGRYDDAWGYLTKSKPYRPLEVAYDPIVHKKVIDILIETFSSATLLNLPDSGIKNSERPIFIIGMPRSGTSLTEQILASHPEVSGGGELSEISELIDSFPGLIKSGKQWPECIHDVTQEDLAAMANNYLSSLQKICDSSRFVTDKMPHNFYALGLIQMLFPQAKIIHCRRNPMDTCLSIYFQNFLVGHEYAKNLFNLGTHYHQYQRLMQHWQYHLALDIFDLEYESLVDNPKQVISNMLDFCKLEWSDDCMNFYSHDRMVSTASFDQVRQPLHNKSVSRWKNYDLYLDDLKNGIERGY